MKNNYHIPVLLQSVLDFFDPQPGQVIVDATLGGGSHTLALAKAGAQVLAFDQDQDAIDHFKGHSNVKLFHTNFSQLVDQLKPYLGKIDAILFDLGVSSHQLDTESRGFSFQTQAKLDMRMDKRLQVTAADLINALSAKELTQLFTLYAKPRWARAVAKQIVASRPIHTTNQLADLISSVVKEPGRIHPATTFFQALRMAVNTEIDSLKQALSACPQLLKPGGKLAVISFHQGEDVIIKNFLKDSKNMFKTITQKPIIPSQQEIADNPRSRSAKLRQAIKL